MPHAHRHLLLFSLLPWLGGCGLFSSSADAEAVSGDRWLSYDASRRGGVLLYREDSAKKPVFLGEPVPDAVFTSSVNLALKAAEKGELSVEFAESITELGGRTEAVLLLREMMYRLSEQSVSNEHMERAAPVLFASIVDAAREIAIADRVKAVTAGVDSLAVVLASVERLEPTSGGEVTPQSGQVPIGGVDESRASSLRASAAALVQALVGAGMEDGTDGVAKRNEALLQQLLKAVKESGASDSGVRGVRDGQEPDE